jgi:CheY-like chemotaxis protein
MDIYKLLDLLERVETNVSALYKKLQEDHYLNKEAADFFLGMHFEEESHVQFIRMERRIIQAAPKVFKDTQVNLSEINSLLENVANLKTGKLELPALLGRVYGIESSQAEKYLIDALKDSNDELRDFLIQLSATFDTHAEKVSAFARKIGVQIEKIENRHLRKARVGYGEKVLVNRSESVKGVDISERGMFLLTPRIFRTGESISVQFSVLQNSITADAVVQYMIEAVGIGIQFTGLQEREQELISGYVAQRIEEQGLDKQKRLLLVGNAREAGLDVRFYVHELISAGYKVVDISGFEDAVSSLRKGMDLSCIILAIESDTDPNYFLLRFLPTVDRYRNVPVIVMTNNPPKELREALIRSGVLRLLTRSTTSPKRLTEEVNSVTA